MFRTRQHDWYGSDGDHAAWIIRQITGQKRVDRGGNPHAKVMEFLATRRDYDTSSQLGQIEAVRAAIYPHEKSMYEREFGEPGYEVLSNWVRNLPSPAFSRKEADARRLFCETMLSRVRKSHPVPKGSDDELISIIDRIIYEEKGANYGKIIRRVIREFETMVKISGRDVEPRDGKTLCGDVLKELLVSRSVNLPHWPIHEILFTIGGILGKDSRMDFQTLLRKARRYFSKTFSAADERYHFTRAQVRQILSTTHPEYVDDREIVNGCARCGLESHPLANGFREGVIKTADTLIAQKERQQGKVSELAKAYSGIHGEPREDVKVIEVVDPHVSQVYIDGEPCPDAVVHFETTPPTPFTVTRRKTPREIVDALTPEQRREYFRILVEYIVGEK